MQDREINRTTVNKMDICNRVISIIEGPLGLQDPIALHPDAMHQHVSPAKSIIYNKMLITETVSSAQLGPSLYRKPHTKPAGLQHPIYLHRELRRE